MSLIVLPHSSFRNARYFSINTHSGCIEAPLFCIYRLPEKNNGTFKILFPMQMWHKHTVKSRKEREREYEATLAKTLFLLRPLLTDQQQHIVDFAGISLKFQIYWWHMAQSQSVCPHIWRILGYHLGPLIHILPPSLRQFAVFCE